MNHPTARQIADTIRTDTKHRTERHKNGRHDMCHEPHCGNATHEYVPDPYQPDRCGMVRQPNPGGQVMYPANQLQADEAAEARAERADWIEDQFGYGFNSADIAADLGITQNSVARSMYRAKRPDLARRFERWERPSSNRNYSHGYTCDGCGDRRSNNSVKWCLRCRNRFGTRAAA